MNAVNAVNAPHSKGFAQIEDARQSRSVWTARVFSAAFRREWPSGKSQDSPESHDRKIDDRKMRANGFPIFLSSIFLFFPLSCDSDVGGAGGGARLGLLICISGVQSKAGE